MARIVKKQTSYEMFEDAVEFMRKELQKPGADFAIEFNAENDIADITLDVSRDAAAKGQPLPEYRQYESRGVKSMILKG